MYIESKNFSFKIAKIKKKIRGLQAFVACGPIIKT